MFYIHEKSSYLDLGFLFVLLDVHWSSSCINWTESLLPLPRWFFFFVTLSITKAENASSALCTRTLFQVQWVAFPSCSPLDPLTCLRSFSSSFFISCVFPSSTFSSFYFRMLRDSIICLEKICLILVAKLLAIQSFLALSYIIHVW